MRQNHKRQPYKQHRLQPLQKTTHKQQYIGFDVETYENKQGYHEFILGGLWWIDEQTGKERFKYFIDREKMIQYIINRRHKNKTIVATNLPFDLTVLFTDTPYWNELHMISRSGDIMQATYEFKQNNGKIRFIDTLNYAPFGVKTLGEIITLPTLTPPNQQHQRSIQKTLRTNPQAVEIYNYSPAKKLKSPDWLGKRPPKNLYEQQQLITYNKRDCEISARFMHLLTRGLKEFESKLQISIASTALDVWRRNFLDRQLTKEEYIYDQKITDFIFEGYYGGRTEVFKRGRIQSTDNKTYYYYDVNSLYPAVMRLEYPLPQSVRKIDHPHIQHILKQEGVSRVRVKTPNNIQYPVLPLRTENKLLFPKGEFEGVYNHVELRKALTEGYTIQRIDEQIIYAETFSPFTNFVEQLYTKRMKYKSEDSPLELVVKLIMNSLYGKFAQKRRENFRILHPDHFTKDEEKKFYRGEFGGDFEFKNGVLMRTEESVFRGKHSFPILSSYVTSYARILMFDYIKECEAVYTDTDSIITTKQIPESSALGKMKLEQVVHEGYIVRPKFYMLDGKPKIKGCMGMSQEEFHDVLRGGSVKKMRFTKLRESFRRGLHVNTVLEDEKRLSLEDTKRNWSTPFNPEELQHSTPLEIQTNDELKELTEMKVHALTNT